MTYRTRLTPWGVKTRFKKKKEKPHGPIKRVVGDTPMMTLAEAAWQMLSEFERELLIADILERYGPAGLEKALKAVDGTRKRKR
jgi:hypothetical protein